MTDSRDTRQGRSHDVMVALGLSIGAAVALGFSRFAYALLLPPMRESLGWTYAQAGSLNTANAVGYIAGALAAAICARRWGESRVFQIGLLVSALVLLLTAATSSLPALFLLRTIGGASTALTFILGAALAGGIAGSRDAARSGLLVGIYVAGASAGIVLSGLTEPIALAAGPSGWWKGWIVLGAIAILGVPPAWMAARSVQKSAGKSAAILPARDFRQLAPAFLGYALFGAGYAGYMTFVIALLRNQGGSSGQVTLFWIVLGLVSTVTTMLWGRILARFSGGVGPALVFALTALGTLPPLLSPTMAAAFASALLFGGSVMAGPAAITVVAKQQVPAAVLTVAIAFLTVAFALGQAAGPLLSGVVSDMTGSVAAGLWASPILLGLAAAASLLQGRAP